MRCVDSMWVFGLGVLLLACAPAVARAQVYRCIVPNGAVSYQDHACAQGQKQKVLDVPSHAPPGYVPSAPATVAPPASGAGLLPAPPYMPPSAPLPAMYACIGAVNGKHYLTRRPPPPYLAPLGVMGYPPQTLSQAYGSPGGAGMSAPEVTRKPRIGGPSIATGMTEVQDFCLPAPKAEVCAYVRREYEKNDRKLRMAMPHEQPSYARREQQLQEQLRNCR